MTKGSHVAAAEEVIDSRLGPGRFRSFALDEDLVLPPLVLPRSWHPAVGVAGVIRRAAAALGVAQEALTQEIAAHNADSDLTSIYRVFLKLAAPRRVLANGNALWRTYINFGKVETVRNEPGDFAATLHEIPDDRLMPWIEGIWLGFVPRAVSLAGGHPLRSKTRRRYSPSAGRHAFEYELTWR